MNRKTWERQFLRALKPLSKEEKNAALAYYREMYGDKAETGVPEEEILREFGDPQVCAARIVGEEKEDGEKDAATPLPPSRSSASSVAAIFGIVLFSLIVLLPLLCVTVALIASFAVVSVACAVVSIAGGVYAIVTPFLLSAGGGAVVFANVGLGVFALGLGALLFVAFGALTKLLLTATHAAVQSIFRRRI